MLKIQAMTRDTGYLLWMTAGGLFTAERPTLAIASGLSRALMLEQPSLKFIVFDVDRFDSTHDQTLWTNILHALQQAIVAEQPETEFLQERGLLHISRFIPDGRLNDEFHAKEFQIPNVRPLAECKDLSITMENTSDPESVMFKEVGYSEELSPAEVDLEVEYAGLLPEVCSFPEYRLIRGQTKTC